MPLNPKIRVSEGGIHRRCWFAKADIAAGEWIWKGKEGHTGYAYPIAEVMSWPPEIRERYLALAYEVKEGILFGPADKAGNRVAIEDEKEYYVNHSCSGNCWYEGDELLVASRDIKCGEEITYDYGLTESWAGFSLSCLCKTYLCRGTITGLDYRRPELQARYGQHFLPHVLRKIELERQASKPPQ